MSAKRKSSVFGSKIDNLIRQKEKRLIQERESLSKFTSSLDFDSEGKPWKSEKPSGFKIRFLVYPTVKDTKKGIKPRWLAKPNYYRKMQAGIYIQSGKSWKLFKVIHDNPVELRASSIKSLVNEAQSVFNPIRANEKTQIKISGYTLRNAIDKISIPLQLGDRVAIAIQIKYRIRGEDEFSKSGALSYVENFDEMRNYKTMLSALLDGMAARIRGYLAGKELTFTNHRAMEQIYDALVSRVSNILAKYGLEYIPDATAFRIGELLLKAAGYDKLSDVKAFNDSKVIKDYEKILECYMSEGQKDVKLEKDEIERVSLILDYTFVPRVRK